MGNRVKWMKKKTLLRLLVLLGFAFPVTVILLHVFLRCYFIAEERREVRRTWAQLKTSGFVCSGREMAARHPAAEPAEAAAFMTLLRQTADLNSKWSGKAAVQSPETRAELDALMAAWQPYLAAERLPLVSDFRQGPAQLPWPELSGCENFSSLLLRLARQCSAAGRSCELPEIWRQHNRLVRLVAGYPFLDSVAHARRLDLAAATLLSPLVVSAGRGDVPDEALRQLAAERQAVEMALFQAFVRGLQEEAYGLENGCWREQYCQGLSYRNEADWNRLVHRYARVLEDLYRETVNNCNGTLWPSIYLPPPLLERRSTLLEYARAMVHFCAVNRGIRYWLALECFRRRHGQLPVQLDELVPEFLAELPEDPYSGRPFGYRFPAGTVFSIGYDRIAADGAGDDLVFPLTTAAGGKEAGEGEPEQ